MTLVHAVLAKNINSVMAACKLQAHLRCHCALCIVHGPGLEVRYVG